MKLILSNRILVNYKISNPVGPFIRLLFLHNLIIDVPKYHNYILSFVFLLIESYIQRTQFFVMAERFCSCHFFC